jgi:hypothetical protein
MVTLCKYNVAATGAEAGHDRALSSVPQMLLQNGLTSAPVWGMCLPALLANQISSCPTTNPMGPPSYVVYGDRTPSGSTLKSTRMLTTEQISTAVSELQMSEITKNRLQVCLRRDKEARHTA